MPNNEFLLSGSRLALLNQQNESVMELVNQANGLDGKNPETYEYGTVVNAYGGVKSPTLRE